ncbi:MAG: flagellar motor protein MotB [candidate division Zixibacteria bacterium]|nr:flagellar motor protein MotB [candidate division Zixibacteria bacterium]
MAEGRDKSQPIIVVKKNSIHGGHHGGAWKVAYADFMTAMMAFFLVMWLVTQTDVVKKAVQGYFQDPANFKKNFQISIVNGGAGVLNKPGEGSLPKASAATETSPMVSMDAAELFQQAMKALAGLDVPKEVFDVELTREGLRMQLIEGSDEVMFFRTGSSELTPKGEVILKTIGMELGKLPNQLVVEGHTDGTDLARGNEYTNWELSTDRANAARRAMAAGGLAPDQVREIRGFAANKLRIKDAPLDPRNRRITILVLNRYVGQMTDDEEYDTSSTPAAQQAL